MDDKLLIKPIIIKLIALVSNHTQNEILTNLLELTREQIKKLHDTGCGKDKNTKYTRVKIKYPDTDLVFASKVKKRYNQLTVDIYPWEAKDLIFSLKEIEDMAIDNILLKDEL